ncbi:hypothetical protein [uncultured Dokdonia sp.]|uniref:hypothetical protein n=1 Tax=uncultured Dokdonia sp. TaxID=575653 RepID=UPI002611F971|nr:hypothetical protein [uncultured Dokdonia sp.]
MRKSVVFIIFLSLFLNQNIFSQKINIEEDQVSIEYVKGREASLFNPSNVYTRSKDAKTIVTRVKMKNLNNKKELFDPNKFSLIIENEKVRLRPVDILFKNFTDWWHFSKVSKTKPSDKKSYHKYNPDIKDTYLDYNKEGIKNFELPINLGTRKKPEEHILYFVPKKLRSRGIRMYFILPENISNGTLYYGNTKIKELEF